MELAAPRELINIYQYILGYFDVAWIKESNQIPFLAP